MVSAKQYLTEMVYVADEPQWSMVWNMIDVAPILEKYFDKRDPAMPFLKRIVREGESGGGAPLHKALEDARMFLKLPAPTIKETDDG